MGMNYIQPNTKENLPLGRSYNNGRSAFIKRERMLELTRDEGFLDGTKDIFDLLGEQKKEHDIMARSLGATIALLKRSGYLLQDAEDKIAAHEAKLETLEKLATYDEVSGLLNRRGFIQAFRQETARALRGNYEGGLLVMFNLENLGRIRKTSGADAAHAAVKLIAHALLNEIRECDHAGRVAEEEFILLFSNTNMEQALTRLQNMALRLNKLSLIHEGREINLNLSLGLKSFKGGERAEKIFKAASDDLERNRKKGDAKDK